MRAGQFSSSLRLEEITSVETVKASYSDQMLYLCIALLIYSFVLQATTQKVQLSPQSCGTFPACKPSGLAGWRGICWPWAHVDPVHLPAELELGPTLASNFKNNFLWRQLWQDLNRKARMEVHGGGLLTLDCVLIFFLGWLAKEGLILDICQFKIILFLAYCSYNVNNFMP